MPRDIELAALLIDTWLEVHVLTADGVPAGFAQLELRTEGVGELVLFGLMPGFIGHGPGWYFLRWAIDGAWNYCPRRVWLHICTNHPAALSNHRRGRRLQGREQGVR